MSFAIDVNILLYASDASSRFHRRAAEFLRDVAAGSEVVCLAWSTAMAYVRIATHPSVFQAPLSPDDAADNLETLLRQPHVRLLTEEDGFWDVYREVTRGLTVRGNLVPDAHLASVLRQHGVRRLYTNDTDFRKFAHLDVRNPFR